MTEVDAPKKSPVLAGLIGALAPGVGHAYAGHPFRGLAWMLAPVMTVVAATTLASETSGGMLKALFGTLFVAYVASIVDAVLLARRAPRDGGVLQVALVAIFGVIVVPTGVALTLRFFVIEAFKIPSGAMIPSLSVGDHLFADKVVYRKRAPHRGEMMIFAYPEHPDQDFVKRVIGLPGDRLEARGGHPIINGWEVPSCRVGVFTYVELDGSTSHTGDLYVEFLDDEAYFTLYDREAFGSDYQGPYTFDAFFVMGDNRNNSHDSRMWFGGNGGGVPRSNVKGRARYQWMPRIADYASPLVAPLPELAAPLEQCMKQRPPREKTSPPKR